MLAVILFQIFFPFPHKTGGFTPNWRVYTKLEGLHQTGGFTPNWRVYTKLEDLHKNGGFIQIWRFTPNWRIYTKLEGLYKTGGFIQNLEGLHQIGGFTQNWRICITKTGGFTQTWKLEGLHKTEGFTQTCSIYCGSFKWQELLTAFNLCPTKPEGLHEIVAVIAAVSNGKSLTAFNLCPTKLEGLHCNIWTAMLQSLLYFSCNHRLNGCDNIWQPVESILVICLARVCKFNAESILMTCKLLIHQQQPLLQLQTTTAQISMDVMLNKILTFHSILLLLTI